MYETSQVLSDLTLSGLGHKDHWLQHRNEGVEREASKSNYRKQSTITRKQLYQEDDQHIQSAHMNDKVEQEPSGNEKPKEPARNQNNHQHQQEDHQKSKWFCKRK